MILVCYNEEQDCVRLYNTEQGYKCWTDMESIGFPRRLTSLAQLIDWGWEVVGEL